MSKCDTCGRKVYGYLCDGCIHDPENKDLYEPMTNADRIRAMSDDELAEFLWEETDHTFSYCGGCEHYSLKAPHCGALDDPKACIKARVEWLQQPAKENAEVASDVLMQPLEEAL